jgi:hypothetical protein
MADKVDPRTGELTTANYGWVKPTVGASVDAWGGYINTDLDGIDSTVHGVQTSIPVASSTTPGMDGTAAVGVGTTYARADHTHPTDTSRAPTTSLANYLPLAGGTLTGAVTPSQTAGVVGTTTNNNANAGAIGEYINVDHLTNVAMTTSVAINIASISLTAGDWDVEGNVQLSFSVGGSVIYASISTISATLGGGMSGFQGFAQLNLNAASLTAMILPTGPARVSIAATTPVYLVGYATFSSGTCNGQGSIFARRRR